MIIIIVLGMMGSCRKTKKNEGEIFVWGDIELGEHLPAPESYINLNAPEDMKELVWPTNGIGSILPPPSSNVGSVVKDSSDSYIVQVGGITVDDYAEYVKACEAIGFTVDYSRYEETYTAMNEEGYKVSLKYVGFNIMEVSICAPEKRENEIKENISSTEQENVKSEDSRDEEVADISENTAELVDGMRPQFKEVVLCQDLVQIKMSDSAC